MSGAYSLLNMRSSDFRAVKNSFGFRFFIIFSLLTMAGCDSDSIRKDVLSKYLKHDIYSCSPSGFGQQSHCTLKM